VSQRIRISPEALHKRYASRIDRRIRAVLGTDFEREDLVHEVLMIVIRRAETVRDVTLMDAWVNQVTVNQLRYVMRQRGIRRRAQAEVAGSERLSPHADFEARDIAARAMRIIERMPAADQTHLLRHWFSTTTAAEIAADEGCSIITIRRRLSRARSRFERLARRDPALAKWLDNANVHSRR
jgi:RNA polymerase sigma-70 factor (ECF subfamily)